MNRNHSGGRLGNSGLGAGLGLGFLLAVASLGSAGTQATDRVGRSLRITVRVYNYAVVSRGTLLRAEEEGSRIFREAGVELAWLDCPTSHAEEEKYPACDPPLGAMAVDLRILPAPMAERLTSSREEAGSALASARAGRASAAWVFYQRVEELAASQVASPSQVLGHAIAHEIGHLLLGPNSHSRTGIMRANWDRRYLQEASWDRLLFTRDQAELIRADVSTRNGMQQAAVDPGIGAEPGLKVIASVYNYARVEPATLALAENQALTIFQHAGVTIVWRDIPLPSGETRSSASAPPDEPSTGFPKVYLRIVPSSMSPLNRLDTLGCALLPSKSRAASDAWVLFDRIEQAASLGIASQHQILGHAMAHEIGHLLLGQDAHSVAGVMRADWRAKDYVLMSQGSLFFTPRQAELMGAEVRARRDQQEKVASGPVAFQK